MSMLTFDRESMNGFRFPKDGLEVPVLDSAELEDEIETDIRYYGTLDSEYGNFMIGIMETLLRRVRFTGARTVSEYIDRRAAMDADPSE